MGWRKFKREYNGSVSDYNSYAMAGGLGDRRDRYNQSRLVDSATHTGRHDGVRSCGALVFRHLLSVNGSGITSLI